MSIKLDEGIGIERDIPNSIRNPEGEKGLGIVEL